jgi:tetraacyldisaccharide 4'-kinase
VSVGDPTAMIAKPRGLKRALLWLPAKLYELAVRLRVAAYETEYLKPKRLNSIVISVGNITLGGTGKTPFVEYIARYLKEEGYSVAILTRGYSRGSHGRRVLNGPTPSAPGEINSGGAVTRSGAGPRQPISQDGAPGQLSESALETLREFGDEPLMLARVLQDVPVIIDKDRFAGGEWAERETGSRVMILDDAYQHLALSRDLNILLVDATDPFGGFEMAPFGRLREPLYGLKRADAVIVTRAHRPFDQGQVLTVLELFCGEKVPVMYFHSTLVRLRHLATGEIYDAREFAGWNAALMCGIGNPQAFADDVLQIGVNIVSESFFADHHHFTQEELDRVNRAAGEAQAHAILVTEKDAVRLEGLRFGDIPVYAAQLEIQGDDEVRLKSLLLRTVTSKTVTNT